MAKIKTRHIHNTLHQYGVISKFLHWLMALMIIGLLGVGLYMVDLPNTPFKGQMYMIHKSTGFIVLILLFVRFIWRISQIIPTLPENLKPIHQFLAHSSSYILYILMFIMTFSGFIMSQASHHPIVVYNLFTVPSLVPNNELLAAGAHGLHVWAGYAFIFIIALHVLAALSHHFILNNSILSRMLPFQKGVN